MSNIDTAVLETSTTRHMLSKVPEITIWFWIIKILCTTVGESFADWINMALGVGLSNTAIIFTVVMAAVLFLQMRLRRYVPGIYWLTVVVLSITGTLYTDILTDQLGIPLAMSSAVFAVLLAIVFGVWYAKEHTLSIHKINSTPREGFYWLAVLVTFALGTAVGDWTLELTGWGPGASILLPAALIAIVTVLWRLGMNPVLSFWIAYILTRPLGANIGDFLASPKDQQGLGLGTMLTSVIFLALILATVIYLTISKSDVTENKAAIAAKEAAAPKTSPHRERWTLVAMGVVAVATVGLLGFTNSQPHQNAASEDGPAPTCTAGATPLTMDQARAAAKKSYPAKDIINFRTIASDTLGFVQKGDQKSAATRITDLEKAWDVDQPTLFGADCNAWTFIDQKMDPVLKSVRAKTPSPAAETKAIKELLATLPQS